MTRSFIIFILFTCFGQYSFSQELIRTTSKTARLIDRIGILSNTYTNLHTSIRNPSDKEAASFVMEVLQNDSLDRNKFRSDINYIITDKYRYFDRSFDSLYSTNKPVLKYFYKVKSKFYSYEKDGFSFDINPLIDVNITRDFQTSSWYFQNTRGLKMNGQIGQNIRFYTSLFENQRNFPAYMLRRIEERKAIPGQGFYKNFNSTLIPNIKGFDYLNAEAYIGVQLTKQINIHFGHSNFFIGNGIRSLLLSQYGHNYLFLKINTNLGRFHYQNLFAELTAHSATALGGDLLLPKKFMASHFLSFRPFPSMEIGLFEAVIFSREAGFELQYLNPVIFYRTVEQFIGSPDNVLIGLNANWDLFNTIRVYGQCSIDEFKLNEILDNKGWWGNKYGFQLGLKYINVFGIDHVDLQIETNQVRPFTYGHQDSVISYSHYNQALAHPLGANFREFIIRLDYQPHPKLFINASFLHAQHGENDLIKNYGGDILISSNTIETEYNHYILQGIPRKINQYQLGITYSFYHNTYLDVRVMYRTEKSENSALNRYFIIGPGIRMNVDHHDPDY